MKKLMLGLLISVVFFGSYTLGACIGGDDSEVGIHEEALVLSITATNKTDNVCLAGTSSGIQIACRYSSDGTSQLWHHLENYDHINIYTEKGNDTVVVSSTEVCQCACPNSPQAYGTQGPFVYPDPGNNSNVITFWDSPLVDGSSSGNDKYFGGSGRNLYAMGNGSNICRGGKYRDVYSADPNLVNSAETYWDPGYELDPDGIGNFYQGSSGIDHAFDWDCHAQWPCDGEGSVLDVFDCIPAGCDNWEINADVPMPACPSPPFPDSW